MEKRKRDSSVCPMCHKDLRYRQNSTLICSGCGFEIDAKRESDKNLLPERSDDLLRQGGY